jgi:CheY-like chemotaxis protein
MEKNPQATVTILMAEDDNTHALLMERVLRKAGLNNPILRFMDGQEVLDFLNELNRHPDAHQGQAYLLLLDIYMPRVDGVEVLRELKADAALKNIPVIMLTTADDPEEIQHCYALGCNLFVTKPHDASHFAEALNTLTQLIRILSVAPLGKNVLDE